jgi:hypothetical protein
VAEGQLTGIVHTRGPTAGPRRAIERLWLLAWINHDDLIDLTAFPIHSSSLRATYTLYVSNLTNIAVDDDGWLGVSEGGRWTPLGYERSTNEVLHIHYVSEYLELPNQNAELLSSVFLGSV